MEIRVKINIVSKLGTPFMGSGPLRLLERIQEKKSINQAAREMRLSYVKALKILNRLEENLGRQLLIRKRGGNDRGGAELTHFARYYLAAYREMQERIRAHADAEVEVFFEDLDRILVE